MAAAEPPRKGGGWLRRLALAVAFGVGGYAVGAVLGYALVVNFSNNTHDRALEAAATAAFFVGPLAALLAAAVGAIMGGRR